MDAERWRQIETLFNAARKHGAEALAGADPDVRREVELLLAQQSKGGLSAEPVRTLSAKREVLVSGDGTLVEEPVFNPGRLPSGTNVGPYTILEPIGAGGMGEVYRAHDSKLRRDVAIKVLPSAFVNDPERLARFQREARLLAALNHPNIAAIYGFEDTGNAHALVMELVEGPTLADRIRRGPIPIDEALPIAKQISDALEYAHEHGIVHRDLKPSNIKVTAGDTVKILDFGLAKALEADAGSADVKSSPTISHLATQSGILLGTAAYMSPEQAKGKPVDRRADIWAFGCVLYEMLTGKMAFHSETVADTLAAVLKNEPDWSHLPTATPAHIRFLIRRCLQKEPRQRLRDIGDARILLEEFLFGAPEDESLLAVSAPNLHRLLPWALGLLAVAAAGLAVWHLKPSPAFSRPVTRTVITLPQGQRLAGLGQQALTLSPDGSQIAYIATTQGSGQQLYLRAMDNTDARPLAGTEGASNPFFSPDGQWVGFFAGGRLKKISVEGGVAQTLSDVVNPFGASWGSQHTIVFAAYSSALQMVSDGGGAPQPLTRLAIGEIAHRWPEFLPGGEAVLFAAVSASSTAIAVHSTGAGGRRNLMQMPAGGMPRYVPSGHLICAQAGNLMAAPFDPERMEVTSGAVPVVQGLLQSERSGGVAQYSVSASGSLVYVSGVAQTFESRLVWVGRNGEEQALSAPARIYNQPRLSPDGRRVAVDVVENPEKMQVWLYDLTRDTFARFTFEGVNRHPVWSPDGRRIAFMSNREGITQIFWQLADGSGGLERLTTNTAADVLDIPYSWSPDGQLLTFVDVGPTPGAGFWMLRVGDSSAGSRQRGKAERFLQTRTVDGAPQLSPDGRWLAYASDESGRREIYVQAFPGPGGKWQVSTDGGNEPQWNRNGRELFYVSGDKMMAVDITTQPGFASGKPRQLFEGHYVHTGGGYVRANYDVSLDGQRFLMLKPIEQEQPALTEINVVLNWTEELKRLVPPGTK